MHQDHHNMSTGGPSTAHPLEDQNGTHTKVSSTERSFEGSQAKYQQQKLKDLFYTTIREISTGGPSAGNQLEGHQQNII